MAEQMILESWESDEAQDWESDEAIAESDESAEDIGEAARRRKSGYSPARGGYSAGRGIRGMRVSGPDGVRTVSFPARVATTAETNRGLANQELARRSLEERLERFERRLRAQQKSGVSATGLAFLIVGGGLTLWGLGKTLEAGSGLNGWAKQDSTAGAALFSAGQLAITGSTLALTGVYSRSMLHIMANGFAAGQLAAYAFGSWYTPASGVDPSIVISKADLGNESNPAVLKNLKPNDFFVVRDTHKTGQVVADSNNGNTYRYVD